MMNMNMPMPNFQGGPQNNFNQQQFIMGLSQLTQQTLNELISRAKLQGISEQDIQAGLAFINQYRR